MIKLFKEPVQIRDGVPIPCTAEKTQGREETIAYRGKEHRCVYRGIRK